MYSAYFWKSYPTEKTLSRFIITKRSSNRGLNNLAFMYTCVPKPPDKRSNEPHARTQAHTYTQRLDVPPLISAVMSSETEHISNRPKRAQRQLGTDG